MANIVSCKHNPSPGDHCYTCAAEAAAAAEDRCDYCDGPQHFEDEDCPGGRQKMILKSQRVALLANGAANLVHRLDDGNTEDFWPVVKLFNPCGAATWLLSELDEDGDTAFGLCDLGMGEPELGYVSLAELASIKLLSGALYIERDRHFTAKKKLGDYAAEARRLGRIEVC